MLKHAHLPFDTLTALSKVEGLRCPHSFPCLARDGLVATYGDVRLAPRKEFILSLSKEALFSPLAEGKQRGCLFDDFDVKSERKTK
jgi:hypothetical protein